MNISEIFQLLTSNFWIYIGAFVLVLSILVFVHEWGHYIAARLCGVKVEVFSIGFGHELFGFNDKRGTRWKVSLIPLGGFVKLFGDVDPTSVKHEEMVKTGNAQPARPMTAEERKEAFFSQPVWKRAIVVVAGPAINYVFAIILLSFIFAWNGQPVTPPTAAAIIGGSAADAAGFQPHDTVLSIDGKDVRDFEDIRREMMIGLDGQKHFVITRNGKKMDLFASPKKIEIKDRFGFKHQSGLLGLISPRHAVELGSIQKVDGVSLKDKDKDAVRAALNAHMGHKFTIEIGGVKGSDADILTVQPQPEYNKALNDPNDQDHDLLFVADARNDSFIKYAPPAAIGEALRQTWIVSSSTVEALGQIVMGTRSPTELGGVIRIGALAGDMAKQGVIAFVLFMALLSINLGLVNLFPIPMLDGGHLMFYAFEAIIGRPISDRVQEYAFRFGLVFLVTLMVFANLNDIMQLIL